MNSIYFHFNGDVNINLSLPDSADRQIGRASCRERV